MDEAARHRLGRKKPLIGVTGPDRNHRMSWNFLRACITLAGGEMLPLTPSDPRFPTPLQGLIISGGIDIDPTLYGRERKRDYPYNPSRDTLEMRWATQALEHGTPLLGICRGSQMLNVCLGGTLHLDIKLICESAHYPHTIWSKVFARKPVVTKEGSMLREILGSEVLRVNSLHRQSLDEIGAGLTVTAWEENSIVQAVEGGDPHRFLLGVQWHPEFMINAARQQRIFHALLAHAAEYTHEI